MQFSIFFQPNLVHYWFYKNAPPVGGPVYYWRGAILMPSLVDLPALAGPRLLMFVSDTASLYHQCQCSNSMVNVNRCRKVLHIQVKSSIIDIKLVLVVFCWLVRAKATKAAFKLLQSQSAKQLSINMIIINVRPEKFLQASQSKSQEGSVTIVAISKWHTTSHQRD